jgi:hypothetical protein
LCISHLSIEVTHVKTCHSQIGFLM